MRHEMSSFESLPFDPIVGRIAAGCAAVWILLASCATDAPAPPPSRDGDQAGNTAPRAEESPERAPVETANEPALETPESGADHATEPGPPGTAAPSSERGDCEDEFAPIRRLYDTIPYTFGGLSQQRLLTVTERVRECRARLEAYLERCPSANAASEARYELARLLLAYRAMQAHELENLEGLDKETVADRMAEYDERTLDLCNDFLANSPQDHPRRPDALKLRGDLLNEHLAGIRGDAARVEALESYLTIWRDFPQYDRVGDIVLKMANTYYELGRAREGVTFLREAMKRYPDHEGTAYFYERLWKLTLLTGNLEALLAWCVEVRSSFPGRLERPGLSADERTAYLLIHGYAGYRKGFSLWALGRIEEAVAAYEAYLGELSELPERLDASSRKVLGALNVYATVSRNAIQILRTKVGRPPPADVDRLIWLSDRVELIGQNLGKVVGLMVRGLDDPRSKDFAGRINSFAREHADDMILIHLCFLRGTRDEPAQIARAREEARELGLEGAPLGADPGPPWKTIEALELKAGSARILVYDREGHLAWWQVDPVKRDAAVVRSIMQRLAGE